MEAPIQTRHTKILATIGPASATEEKIAQLIDAGVSGFRLNFSHGEHDVHATNVQNIRKIAEQKQKYITILQDLQGPKIRVGEMAENVEVEIGQTFTLDANPTLGGATRVHLPHPEILEVLQEGDPVYINDGVVRMRVYKKEEGKAICKVEAGGVISSRKGLNLPGVDLPFSALTEKDREDALFGQKLDVDWVALSFVQRPEDIAELRTLLGTKSTVRIMAKIEMPNAVKRIDSIIDEVDGIMVARGDLGVELPLEEVPPVQKKLVRHCREQGKIVVVATQMLESMTQNNTPTRAEVSDVANATYEGADTLMLSAETATGKYPVQAVEVMARVIARVEQSTAWKPLLNARNPVVAESIGDGITYGAYQIANALYAACIVTFTTSGSTALRMSRQRPMMPVLMLTPNKKTACALNLGWGLQPQLSSATATFEELESVAENAAKASGLGRSGEHVLLTAGVPFGVCGSTNMIRVFKLK